MATLRTRHKLAAPPPPLTNPLILDAVDTAVGYGFVNATSGATYTAGNNFGTTQDIVVRMPRGWNYTDYYTGTSYGLNTRQTTPLRCSAGFQITGGRNVVICGGEIDVDRDWATLAGTSIGAAKGANARLRAVVINHNTTGTVHIEGMLISGSWLYEAIDLRGATDPAATRFQIYNCRIAAVPGPDGETVGVRFAYIPGTPPDHDGGDVLQTQGNWGHIDIDGLEAESCWFQGLFCKLESGFTGGTLRFQNVYFSDYQGPGGVLYINTPGGVSLDNYWVQPSQTRQNSANPPPRLSTTKSIETLVWNNGSNVTKGSDLESDYAAQSGSLRDLNDASSAGAVVRSGTPKFTVLSGRPGAGYVSPGYLAPTSTSPRIPG